MAAAGRQPSACLATFLVTAPRSGCINDHYGRCGLTARTLFGHMPGHSTPVRVHCGLPTRSPFARHSTLVWVHYDHYGRCGPPARILFGRHGSPVWARHDHCSHCGLPARSLFGHMLRHSTINVIMAAARILFGGDSSPVWARHDH